MPRGPVFAAGKAGKGSRAFRGPISEECERCQGGKRKARCTCVVQDRCSAMNDRGHQCILGAGHAMRHVTAAGKHWA